MDVPLLSVLLLLRMYSCTQLTTAVKFECLLAAIVKLAVLGNMTPCSSAPTFWRVMLPPSSALKMQCRGGSCVIYRMYDVGPTRFFFQLDSLSFLLSVSLTVFSWAAEFPSRSCGQLTASYRRRQTVFLTFHLCKKNLFHSS
jgi:hypothetical protein